MAKDSGGGGGKTKAAKAASAGASAAGLYTQAVSRPAPQPAPKPPAKPARRREEESQPMTGVTGAATAAPIAPPLAIKQAIANIFKPPVSAQRTLPLVSGQGGKFMTPAQINAVGGRGGRGSNPYPILASQAPVNRGVIQYTAPIGPLPGGGNLPSTSLATRYGGEDYYLRQLANKKKGRSLSTPLRLPENYYTGEDYYLRHPTAWPMLPPEEAVAESSGGYGGYGYGGYGRGGGGGGYGGYDDGYGRGTYTPTEYEKYLRELLARWQYE